MNFSIPSHLCLQFINDVLNLKKHGTIDFKIALKHWNKTPNLLKILWSPIDLETHQEKENFLSSLETRRKQIIPKEEREKLFSKL